MSAAVADGFWVVVFAGVVVAALLPVWAYRVGLRGGGPEVRGEYRRRVISLYRWIGCAAVLGAGGWWLAGTQSSIIAGVGIVMLVAATGLVVMRIIDGCGLVGECFRVGRSARTARLHLCPNCEYDLRGNESHVCSECGLQLPHRRGE
ncbi:MAG TPA: hypothetical protein P5572_13420 [Phycisphaerae bacterium]|nr:hypothetical protein [Phycisphaerae bacterium]